MKSRTKNSLMGGAMRFAQYCSIGEEGAAGADSGGSTDNSGGNAGTSGNDSGTADNAGTGFDAASFWNEPSAAGTGSPSGGSAESAAAAGGTQQQVDKGAEFATNFAKTLENVSLGKEPFSAEVIAELAEGKTEGINAALQGLGREAVRQSVLMTAQLMQAHGESMMAKFEAMFESKMGNRDNSETLIENFPAAKDPALRPTIQGVFDQSLKHTKGDRAKAVEMTRGMLKFIGKNASEEFGIESAPSSSGDLMTAGAKNLVQELLTR